MRNSRGDMAFVLVCLGYSAVAVPFHMICWAFSRKRGSKNFLTILPTGRYRSIPELRKGVNMSRKMVFVGFVCAVVMIVLNKINEDSKKFDAEMQAWKSTL